MLFECQRRGIRVPEELSVIGFGDLQRVLTTIRPSRDVIGLEVARLIIESVKNRTPAGSVIDTSFLLVDRRST